MAERFIIEIDFSQTRKTPMSKKLEPAQGGGNPKQPLGKMSTIPQRDGMRIIRNAGNDVAREDARVNKPRPAQPLKDKPDWRRG
jgi:hypothetical protein